MSFGRFTIRQRVVGVVSAALRTVTGLYLKFYDSNRRRHERVISAADVSKVVAWLYAPQRRDESEAEMLERRNVGHVLRSSLLTGARKGELLQLRWEQIDWQAMVVQLVATKRKNQTEPAVRYLKITSTLAEIFGERLRSSKGDYVFSCEGREDTHFGRVMREACEACGLRYGPPTDNAGRRIG